MGRLFKKRRDGKVAGPWVARFRDGNGLVVERSTRCRDKSAARQVLADWETEAEKIRAGIVSAAELDTAAWGRVPLEKHNKDYAAHLEMAGATSGHIRERRRLLKRVATDCGFRVLEDVTRTRFERWLLTQQREGMGARNRNVHRAALVGFCNWAVRESRLRVTPLEGVPVANEKADRRHERRVFTDDELARLLDAARRRPVHDRENKNRGLGRANLKAATRAKLEALGHERALTYLALAMRRGSGGANSPA